MRFRPHSTRWRSSIAWSLDWETAEQLYEQALAMSRELEDQEPIAIGLFNLSMVSIGRGSRRERAFETLSEALAIAEAIGSKRAGQSGLEVCAALHVSREEWERAAILFGAAEAQMDRSGFRGDPADEAFLAPLVAKAREALGEQGFASAMATGRALPYEIAIEEARELLEGHH